MMALNYQNMPKITGENLRLASLINKSKKYIYT